MRRAAVLLMGPTGAGKSDLALCLAERLPFEIISVDSALVYRGMDIGTAKPAAAIRARIPHHLIDIRDPVTTYSAGEFVRDAGIAMEEIWSRGRQPLLVGGTMLYFHALTEGIAELPEGDVQIRSDIDRDAAGRGWAAVHADLARIDPEAGERIHANDSQRIQRALEVFRLTGRTITQLQTLRTSVFAETEVQEIALVPERAVLHANIAARFRAMLAAGFLDEVRDLFARGDLTREHPSMRAVGYRQIWSYLEGRSSLADAETKAIVATRQLAKRQMTWLRRRPRATVLEAAHPNVAQALVDALSRSIFAGWT